MLLVPGNVQTRADTCRHAPSGFCHFLTGLAQLDVEDQLAASNIANTAVRSPSFPAFAYRNGSCE